jgi:hypothetical protein
LRAQPAAGVARAACRAPGAIAAGAAERAEADSADEREQAQAEPQPQTKPVQDARAQARQQAAAVRSTAGAVVAPVRPVVTGVTGTLR